MSKYRWTMGIEVDAEDDTEAEERLVSSLVEAEAFLNGKGQLALEV